MSALSTWGQIVLLMLINLAIELLIVFKRGLVELGPSIMRSWYLNKPWGRPNIWAILGAGFRIYYSSMDDLDCAIGTFEQATNWRQLIILVFQETEQFKTSLQARFDDLEFRPGRVIHTENSASALVIRFVRDRRLKYVNHAIMSIEDVMELVPDDDSVISGNLGSLGAILCARFEERGSMNDIDHAIGDTGALCWMNSIWSSWSR